MRIVITRLGKTEIKEVDYEVIPNNNNNTQKNNKLRTISVNKIQKKISIYDSEKTFKQRNDNSFHQKVEYTL